MPSFLAEHWALELRVLRNLSLSDFQGELVSRWPAQNQPGTASLSFPSQQSTPQGTCGMGGRHALPKRMRVSLKIHANGSSPLPGRLSQHEGRYSQEVSFILDGLKLPELLASQKMKFEEISSR